MKPSVLLLPKSPNEDLCCLLPYFRHYRGKNPKRIFGEEIKDGRIINTSTFEKGGFGFIYVKDKELYEVVFSNNEWRYYKLFFKKDILLFILFLKDMIEKTSSELYILQEHEIDRKIELHADLSCLYDDLKIFNTVLKSLLKWEEKQEKITNLKIGQNK